MPDENGETRRQRNERYGEASKTPEIVFPDAGEHIWDWFWNELTDRRKSGPEPLGYAEIGEWQRLTRIQILPEEIAVLIAMDKAYIKAVHEEQDAARARYEAEMKERR